MHICYRNRIKILGYLRWALNNLILLLCVFLGLVVFVEDICGRDEKAEEKIKKGIGLMLLA
jgi:hypothetical protein